MDHIYQIINLWLDGEASDEELIELRRWLKEDDEHCRELYVRVLLHCQLRDQVHSNDVEEVLGDMGDQQYELVDLNDDAGPAQQCVTVPALPPAQGEPAHPHHDGFHFGGITVRRVEREDDSPKRKPRFWRYAAAVTLAALAALWFTESQNDRVVVAKLVNEIDAKWAGDTPDLEAEQVLHAGRLVLESGYAQFLLSNGASVILEGPSDFELIDGERMRLTRGRLSASLRQGADRLEVLSPYARIVDLGTVFGVDVHAGGLTEVEVLDGKISMAPVETLQDQPSQTLVLETGHLARAASGNQVERLPDLQWRTHRFYHSWPELMSRPMITGEAEFLRHVPSSVQPGSLETDHKVLVIQERKSFVTDRPIQVDATEPGVHTGPALAASDAVLPAGSRVVSYLLHYDRLGESGGTESVGMSIRFTQPIVGVIGVSDNLNHTDSTLGSPDIAYKRVHNRGMETKKKTGLDYYDQFEISEDRQALTVKLRTTRGIDQLRVIVASSE